MPKTPAHTPPQKQSYLLDAPITWGLRDTCLLLAFALVISTAAVFGASYVLGKGQAAFSSSALILLIPAGMILFSVVALGIDAAYGYLTWRNRKGNNAYDAHSAREQKSNDTAHIYADTKGDGDSTLVGKLVDPTNPVPDGDSMIVDKPVDTQVSLKKSRRLKRFVPKWTIKSIALFSLIMLIFWLPWIVVNYPGGAYWDTYYQIYQCYPESHPISTIMFNDREVDTAIDAYFSDHHPIFDTLIYGGFARLSDLLFGSWNLGVFIFVCLQGIATIVSFVTSIAYLRKCGAPNGLCLVAFLFFSLFPAVPTWATCMVKDSFFSLFYLPYFLMLFAFIRSKGAVFLKTRWLVLFIAFGLMLCLTKKTGMYVVIPTAIVALVTLLITGRHRATFKRSLCAFGGQVIASVLMMSAVLPLIIFPLLSVAPGGKQEALGLPFQQAAFFVVEHLDEVTDEERAAIDAVIDYDKLGELYTYECQDNVKYSFRVDATPDDIQRFLHVWASLGVRHPETYLASTLSIAGTYLAPVMALNIRMTTCDTWIDDRHVLYNAEMLTPIRLGIEDAYKAWSNLPFVSLPLLACVYVFWLPAMLLFVCLRRRLGLGLMFVPGAIVLVFCLIGPIFDARYCLPLVYTLPLLACMIAASIQK